MFAFLLCLDEIQQFIHRRHQFFVVTENFAGMIQTHLGAIEQPVRFRKAMDRFSRKIITLQRHDVHAARPRRMAFGEHEWRHIMNHSGEAGHESVSADGRKVMYADAT